MMWFLIAAIGLGTPITIISWEILKSKRIPEPVAQPKASEAPESNICDELNELESRILKYPNGMSVPDYTPNQRIFARQTQIMNDYYRAGIDVNMDITTGRWIAK